MLGEPFINEDEIVRY